MKTILVINRPQIEAFKRRLTTIKDKHIIWLQ